MLVLSRKEGERIQIGDDVAVTVVRINASVVRLGIEAPPHIAIVRSELTNANGNEAAVAVHSEKQPLTAVLLPPHLPHP